MLAGRPRPRLRRIVRCGSPAVRPSPGGRGLGCRCRRRLARSHPHAPASLARMSATRAVVLARGLGTRMRAADPSASLTLDQTRMADAGLKPMIPINGRPFLDYVLGALADAGMTDVALVVAPNHDAVRRHYVTDAPPSRIRLSFVVQAEPRGTADAVLAIEGW